MGLSASFVALCDLVYVNDLSKTFFLTPFANIGILAEGGTSATLPIRLGWSKAAEALLLSKRISGQDLQNAGLVNKHYGGNLKQLKSSIPPSWASCSTLQKTCMLTRFCRTRNC